jgi:phenylacetate-CoA ligase
MSLRAELYRWSWEMRGRLASFGLPEALRLVEESQRWPRPRLDDLRDQKLRRAVSQAYAQVPFYRRMMDEHGVRPGDVGGVADLHKLPILTKETLRAHRDELRAQDFQGGDVEVGITGGTTGNPMRVYRDPIATVWQRACYWRGFGWGGFRMGEPWAQVFGGALGLSQLSRKEKAKRWLSGKVFLPAFELGAHNAEEYVETIRKSGARFLVGYASACHLLAQHLERAGRRLPLEAIFPTAELLPESWAETMRRVFGAKILPYYGCGEVQSLAYSCPHAPGVYHVSDEHVVIEVERPDGRAALEGEGTFLITDLDNLAMPLLRYRNGDAGQIAGPGCGCGRTLSRLLRIDGRVSDLLITSRGDAISGLIAFHAFRLVDGVEQFQLVQRRPGQATLRIVRRGGYDPAVEEPKLRKIFAGHLGSEEIDFEYVPSIERTEAGKVRLVRNEHLEALKARGGAGLPVGVTGAGAAAVTQVAV